MRYEKPIVMDLSGRVADGQQPLVCAPGGTANRTEPFPCSGGTVVGTWNEDCTTGGSPADVGPGCVDGGSPGQYAGCYSGGSPFACNQGSNPYTVDFSCEVGPSYV